MKGFTLILFSFILLSLSHSAIIKGTIYLSDLSEANNSYLIINTTPEQFFVLKNASYSIKLEPGNYKIEVFYKEGSTILHSEQNISINKNNSYNIDFILMPDMDNFDLDNGFDELDIDLSDLGYKGKDTSSKLWDVLVVLFSLFIIFYLLKSKKEVSYSSLPKDLRAIIDIIKREEDRITQKDLRKELGWSESKLSLALAELEHTGFIKRIKRGRGKIIILKNHR